MGKTHTSTENVMFSYLNVLPTNTTFSYLNVFSTKYFGSLLVCSLTLNGVEITKNSVKVYLFDFVNMAINDRVYYKVSFLWPKLIIQHFT